MSARAATGVLAIIILFACAHADIEGEPRGVLVAQFVFQEELRAPWVCNEAWVDPFSMSTRMIHLDRTVDLHGVCVACPYFHRRRCHRPEAGAS